MTVIEYYIGKKKMWKILRQANRKCLAPKDNPQKLKIKLISSGVLTLITLHWSMIEKY
jgi:hypothetical protein